MDECDGHLNVVDTSGAGNHPCESKKMMRSMQCATRIIQTRRVKLETNSLPRNVKITDMRM